MEQWADSSFLPNLGTNPTTYVPRSPREEKEVSLGLRFAISSVAFDLKHPTKSVLKNLCREKRERSERRACMSFGTGPWVALF